MVVEIAVGSHTGPLQYAQTLLKRQYYHKIVPKRRSRVETPQHRVLENTLNMGSYFTWIQMILCKARHKGVQTQCKPNVRSQNDHMVNVAMVNVAGV